MIRGFYETADYGDLLIFRAEFKQFFLSPKCLHFIPLMMAGAVLTAWVYPVASPFVPVVIVVFSGLEPQFNNIFYSTPGELETLSVLPVSWRRVVLAKNCATLLLVLLMFILCSMALLYFSPDTVSWRYTSDALLYLPTVLFPALHIGNMRSIQNPRRRAGMTSTDLFEALWMILTIGALSAPYFIMTGLFEVPLLCALYGVGMAIAWYRYSPARTASLIAEERVRICQAY